MTEMDDDPTLSSDHVNYLIWRYLQEQGHGDAAAKFQHSWLPSGGDPTSLAFSDRINRRALVSLVHKGLKYYQVEQIRTPNGAAAAATPPVTLYFGALAATTGRGPPAASRRQALQQQQHQQKPLEISNTNDNAAGVESRTDANYSDRDSARINGTHGADDDTGIAPTPIRAIAPAIATTSTDHHVLDYAREKSEVSTPTAAGAKRFRRSNGTSEPLANGDAMQVDRNGYGDGSGHADQRLGVTSPGAESTGSDDHQQRPANGMDLDDASVTETTSAVPLQAPIVPTLMEGQSIGVQSDSVVDLSAKTVTLTVPEGDNIMHLRWNPAWPGSLAVAGEGLCRIWPRLPERAMQNGQPPHLPMESSNDAYCDIASSGQRSLVTAVAWNSEGTLLAVAARTEGVEWSGAVSTWTPDGRALDDLIAGPDLIIKLDWNDAGNMLLGITSSGNGDGSLIVWDLERSITKRPIACDRVVTDAVWNDSSSLTVCGHGAISRCDISVPDPLLEWGFAKDPGISGSRWSHVRADAISGVTVVAEEDSARLVFIDAMGRIQIEQDVHKDALTAIEFQPPSLSASQARILATASLDGTIQFWDARTAQSQVSLTFAGPDSPPLALAFSLDGRYLAAANYCKILIWSVAHDVSKLPQAVWRGDDLGRSQRLMLTNGHSGDRDSGIGDEEDGLGEPTCSLGWSADGTKLALGVGNQIAIISLDI